jgi:hypothetical protein
MFKAFEHRMPSLQHTCASSLACMAYRPQPQASACTCSNHAMGHTYSMTCLACYAVCTTLLSCSLLLSRKPVKKGGPSTKQLQGVPRADAGGNYFMLSKVCGFNTTTASGQQEHTAALGGLCLCSSLENISRVLGMPETDRVTA